MRPTWLLAVVLISSARDDELVTFPGSIVLDGPKAIQRVLVEASRVERFVGDRTASASFAVEDARVATVSPDGVVTPRGDGRTTLVATVADRATRASIEVRGFGLRSVSSFRNDVAPVLTRSGCNAGSCHGAAAGKNGLRLSLRGYAPEVDFDVLTRQALGRRIDKTSPERSLLLLKPTGAIEHGGGVRFAVNSPEYRILSEWIADGLPRPRDDEPALVGIASFPPAVRLRPGDRQRLIVQATYSNGRVADVTRWAKFASTDEPVAKVDESGQATIEEQGEAAITVGFAGLVCRTIVSVPNEKVTDPAIFATSPRRGPIDEINLKKLESLGIPPSAECSDASFLRRVTLDLTGTLPPAARASVFLASKDAGKRAALIEELLQSPEYVDYWTYKWSDLFLVSSKTLPPPAMWAFSRSIREGVEKNLPWDAFARRILTAKGSTLTEGAANYFVLHRDPIELSDNVSMAFLGMSLTCARCHNHPMEKWTQDQYYGMANMFSRVSLKDGATAGEVIVSPARDGNVIHPRKGVAMAPQPLDGPTMTLSDRRDRREAFTDWLSGADNPYFDRAIVNRVWRNFFGRGLIAPEDDLRASNPASDEALLAWLATDFRGHGRDLKHLIRTIANSAAYSRTSEPLPGNEVDAKFLSHYVVKRLPAEVLLDAIARVSDVPTTFAGYPTGWRTLQLPDAQVANTFLSSFGRPERLTTCSCERSSEPSLTQALHLANGETVNQKLRDDKGLVARLVAKGETDDQVLDALYLAALSRPPTAIERTRLTAVLQDAIAGEKEEKSQKAVRRQAIEDVFWAVLTSKEFLFNH